MKPYSRVPPPGAATALALAFVCCVAISQAQPDAAPAPTADTSSLVSEKQPLAAKSLILDVADAANRAVAVGERGHILLSESRHEWRQVLNVPTRSTLTAVSAVGDKVWAVGHDGVILHSADGGLTWARQRATPFAPPADDAEFDPHNGAPLLDVLFLDEQNGFAIGAYSMMLRTTDGGATWSKVAVTGNAPPPAAEGAAETDAPPAGDEAAAEGEPVAEDGAPNEDSWAFDQSDLELEEESDPHLNGIARTGDGSLFIVAERGSAFRSTDGGGTWQRLQLPYDGSMFGVIGYQGRHVLAFGLRGNVFESLDLGDTWKKLDTGVDLSIMGGTGWEGGGAALVGANGLVLTRSASGTGLLKHSHPDGAVLSTAIALAPGGELVVAGESGIGTYTPN